MKKLNYVFRGMIGSAVVSGCLGLAGIQPAHSADASWGCQVLLCAASSTPSWHGVPYCVPPMTKLIAAMKLPGFSWPICSEGKTGKPGIEQYEPCPAGFSVAADKTVGSGHGSNSGQGSVCRRELGPCRSRNARLQGQGADKDSVTSEEYSESGHGGGQCTLVQTQPRKLRDKPYYFDIPNAEGVKQRFWFDLRE